jgi:hypothetical protein
MFQVITISQSVTIHFVYEVFKVEELELNLNNIRYKYLQNLYNRWIALDIREFSLYHQKQCPSPHSIISIQIFKGHIFTG